MPVDARAVETEDVRPLNVPDREPVEFARNFIRTAVCELRFPTLMEIEGKALTRLQRDLRKSLPNYEKQRVVGVDATAGETGEAEVRHVFSSRKKDFVFTFRTWAIGIEATKYTRFEDFFRLVADVLDVAVPVIDSDFFTRVGLRYLNLIPIEDGDFSGWMNPELVGPLERGVFGTVSRYLQEIRGRAKGGSYTFKHGFVQQDQAAYLLDYDFFAEDVEIPETADILRAFRREAFSFFMWSIGPKVLDRLGAVRPH